MKRVPIIAGNWKLNLTEEESIKLVREIHYNLPFSGEVEVIIAPTLLNLSSIAKHLKKSYIAVSAQNMYFEDKGAFTGECSGKFIKEAGADYVIIGHSERRQFFFETDEIINKKIKAAFRNNLIPIFCIGETLKERESGEVETKIEQQVLNGLIGIKQEEIQKLIIAYEPVWAIGTGTTASPEQVENVHKMIRDLLFTKYGELAEYTRIIYGGSVKSSNSKELLSLPNIDGALVGGASLKAEDFINIILNAGGSKLC